MVGIERPPEILCCFCGLAINSDEEIQMTLQANSSGDERQGLFSHNYCLQRRLRPGVPLHPLIFGTAAKHVRENNSLFQ